MASDELMNASSTMATSVDADGATDGAASPRPRHLAPVSRSAPARPRPGRGRGHVGGDDARRRRNELVEAHRHLAERFVRQYANRGVPRDDLRQTALLALVQAADRFDADLGVEFTVFAGRTIDGTLKRYFRDRTWWVRPPRSLQELHLELRRADEVVSQRIGRRPTVAELAQEVDEDVDRVLEALEAGSAHGALSIDRPVDPDDPVAESAWLGTADGGYARAEARIVVGDLLEGMDERLQEILRLRYDEGLTQQEIADRIGISQSYLSRVIRHGLASMRSALRDANVD